LRELEKFSSNRKQDDIVMTAASAAKFEERVTDPAAMAAQARAASDLMKSLSNETRLMILCLLSSGEMTVSEMEERLHIQQAPLSQQLARLRNEQLVKTRRDGRMIHYSIANPNVSEVVKTLYRLYCPA
jgi:DNA-binding transcriptional ArsR family regulator